MLRKLNDLNKEEAKYFCRAIKYKNRDIINKCAGCPAHVQINKQYTCYYGCRNIVDFYKDKEFDDGSIDENELEWWQR